MISRIIRAPCNLFFDRVPLGRLINRFSGDLSSIDDGFAYDFESVSYCILAFIGALFVCTYLGTLWVFPLCFGFYKVSKRIQEKYITVKREV